ncbi:hypothetical protein LEP1GSC132_0665 [Leptospira kirschneri str. 200803703]|nr:hypothetical protein LEP1GSC132_0665 [Leptospira kirschneri str. 200803703]
MSYDKNSRNIHILFKPFSVPFERGKKENLILFLWNFFFTKKE